MYVLKLQLGRTWYAWSKGLPGTMATVQERKHVHNNDTPKKPDNGWQLVVWAEGTRDRAVRGTPTCSKASSDERVPETSQSVIAQGRTSPPGIRQATQPAAVTGWFRDGVSTTRNIAQLQQCTTSLHHGTKTNFGLDLSPSWANPRPSISEREASKKRP